MSLVSIQDPNLKINFQWLLSFLYLRVKDPLCLILCSWVNKQEHRQLVQVRAKVKEVLIRIINTILLCTLIFRRTIRIWLSIFHMVLECLLR
jgi:hypothetical protein